MDHRTKMELESKIRSGQWGSLPQWVDEIHRDILMKLKKGHGEELYRSQGAMMVLDLLKSLLTPSP